MQGRSSVAINEPGRRARCGERLHATQVISGHQRTLVGPHSVPSISSPMIASTMASSPSGSARTPASNLGEPHAAAHSPMANA
ncbi:hypothetical protein Ctob_005229, partial [Chrysochromulina tobinii]